MSVARKLTTNTAKPAASARLYKGTELACSPYIRLAFLLLSCILEMLAMLGFAPPPLGKKAQMKAQKVRLLFRNFARGTDIKPFSKPQLRTFRECLCKPKPYLLIQLLHTIFSQRRSAQLTLRPLHLCPCLCPRPACLRGTLLRRRTERSQLCQSSRLLLATAKSSKLA